MSRKKSITEDELDEMASDGRLGALAKWLAIQAGADWPSLDGEAQDAWHERAIEQLRSGVPTHDEPRRRG